MQGLLGFCALFVVLVVALPLLAPGWAYALAWAVVLALAWALQRWRVALVVPAIPMD